MARKVNAIIKDEDDKAIKSFEKEFEDEKARGEWLGMLENDPRGVVCDALGEAYDPMVAYYLQVGMGEGDDEGPMGFEIGFTYTLEQKEITYNKDGRAIKTRGLAPMTFDSPILLADAINEVIDGFKAYSKKGKKDSLIALDVSTYRAGGRGDKQPLMHIRMDGYAVQCAKVREFVSYTRHIWYRAGGRGYRFAWFDSALDGAHYVRQLASPEAPRPYIVKD